MKILKLDVRMIRYLLKRTLNYFFYILMPLVAIFIGLFFYVNDSFRSEAKHMSAAHLSQVQSVCDLVFGETKRLIARISLSSESRLFMTPSYMHVRSLDMINQLRSDVLIQRYIDSIYLYSESASLALTDKGLSAVVETEPPQWLRFINYQDMNIAVGTYTRSGVYPYILSFSKPVLVERQSARGAVVVDVDLAEIGAILNRLKDSDGSSAYVLDEQMNVLAGRGMKRVYGRHIEEVLGVDIEKGSFPRSFVAGDMVLSLDKSALLPVYYASVMPLSHFRNLLSDSPLMVLVICIASFFIALLISFVITYKSTDTIRRVVQSIADPMKADHVENDLTFVLGDILQAEQPHVLDEALTTRLYLIKREQAASLQAQISPHFLYNTLDTINWMAYADVGGANRVSDSLATLSDLFRYTLHRGSYVCTLADEIEHMRTYAELLKLRFNGRFQIALDVDRADYGNVALRFMLQPLVENVMQHGVKPVERRTVDICISGHVESGVLTLIVSDNGVGIDEERLRWVNEMLRSSMDVMDQEMRSALSFADDQSRRQVLWDTLEAAHDEGGGGLGLRNVNVRLKLIFGNKYGLSLEKNAGGGVRTLISIPHTGITQRRE